MSLAIQDQLRSGATPDDLKAELGIDHYRHPTLPLVGFKYCQVTSPKLHPVVRDARGIVLEDGTWDVVAKPFRRFFNAGEDAESFGRFDWTDFTCTSKEDGSLVIVYHYRGEWHVNTSRSFGLAKCGDSSLSWREMFWKVSRIRPARLDPAWTYVFEMWTPHTKVVRLYPASVVFLLSAFHVPTLAEASVDEADMIGDRAEVGRPAHFHFASMEDIAAFLREKQATDKTFEGVVIRDRANDRYKVKSRTYVELQHLKETGHPCDPKRLVPLILSGETAELLAYLPEVEPYLREVEARLAEEWGQLLGIWRETHAIPDQKAFALAIADKTPWTSILFTARRIHGPGQTEADIARVWRGSGDAITRRLYG